MIIRDAAIRLTIQQVESVLKAPNIAPIINARKQEQEAGKASVAVENEIFASLKRESDALAGTMASLNTATKTRQRNSEVKSEGIRRADEFIARLNAEEKAEESLRRAVEAQTLATVRAGAGAMQAARGVAFLGVTTGGLSQEWIKSVAVAQGAFDVYSGGARTIKALADVQKANLAATVASRTANIGLAGSFLLVRNAVTGASIAVKGFLVTIGPIGWAVIALTTAYAAWTWATNQQAAADEEAAEAAQKHREAIERQSQALANMHRSDATLRQIEVSSQLEQIALIEDREAKEKALQSVLMERWQIESMIFHTRGAVANARHDEERIGLLERQSSVLEGEIDIRQKLIDLSRQDAEAANRKADNQIKAIRNAEQQVALAERELQLAKDKERSSAESLGRLNERDFARVKDIGERLQRGEQVGAGDLEFFERAGARGRRAASEEFANRGAGRDAELAGLGFGLEGKGIRQAEIEVERAKQAADDAGGGDIETAIAEIEALRRQAVNVSKEQQAQLLALMSEMIEANGKTQAEIEKLRAALSARQ